MHEFVLSSIQTQPNNQLHWTAWSVVDKVVDEKLCHAFVRDSASSNQKFPKECSGQGPNNSTAVQLMTELDLRACWSYI